jgi:hypothetical protein
MSQVALSPPRALSPMGDDLGVGDDCRMILNQWLKATKHWFEATRHYRTPTTWQDRSLDRKFQELANVWKRERGPTSSITEMALHPAYQQIIGMGPAVIPYILGELEQRPDHWFWALRSITGANPVKPEQRGRVKDMAKAWVQWGKDKGYQW